MNGIWCKFSSSACIWVYILIICLYIDGSNNYDISINLQTVWTSHDFVKFGTMLVIHAFKCPLMFNQCDFVWDILLIRSVINALISAKLGLNVL